jgi:hypothetical protein
MFIAVMLTLSCLHAHAETAPSAYKLGAAQKAALSGEIITNLGLEKELEHSFDAAQNFFKRDPRLKDPAASAAYKNTQEKALADFKSKKAVMKSEAIAELNKLITESFTDAELNYLATTSKYQIVVKLVKFVLSQEFSTITQKPFSQVSKSIEEARKATRSAPLSAPAAPLPKSSKPTQ